MNFKAIVFFFSTSLPLWASSYCVWALRAAWVLSLGIISPHFLSVLFFSCVGGKMNGRNRETLWPPLPVCKRHFVGFWNNCPLPKIRSSENYHRGEKQEICIWRLGWNKLNPSYATTCTLCRREFSPCAAHQDHLRGCVHSWCPGYTAGQKIRIFGCNPSTRAF